MKILITTATIGERKYFINFLCVKSGQFERKWKCDGCECLFKRGERLFFFAVVALIQHQHMQSAKKKRVSTYVYIGPIYSFMFTSAESSMIVGYKRMYTLEVYKYICEFSCCTIKL